MKQSKGQLMLCLAVAVLLLAASAPTSTAQDQNVTGTFVETPPATPAETAGATPAAEAPPLDTTAGGEQAVAGALAATAAAAVTPHASCNHAFGVGQKKETGYCFPAASNRL